jgi:hypothetical protein
MKNHTDLALSLAKERGLPHKGLTSNPTGYPEPDLGYFFYGFGTIAEAEAYAAAIPGAQLAEASWKNGWGYAHFRGVYTPGLDGDCPQKGFALDRFQRRDDEFTYHDRDSVRKHALNPDADYLQSALQSIDWDAHFLMVNDYEGWAEAVPRYSMEYHDGDVSTYAIGVWVPL